MKGNWIITIPLCIYGVGQQLKIFILSRLKKFKLALYHAFKKEHSQSLPFDRMMDLIKESGEIFDNNEAKQAIEKMSEDNQVMMANDTIFLI